jgi:nucleotide-binding universal stress UspA family protein
MVEKIIVPIDLEDESSWRKALPVAVDRAKRQGGEIHAVTVLPGDMLRMTVVAQLVPEGYDEALVEGARTSLTGILAEHVPADLLAEGAVRRGRPYKEILHHAEDIGADLIVMAAHRPDMRDYLLGPNAGRVVRHATCSVLVVRG